MSARYGWQRILALVSVMMPVASVLKAQSRVPVDSFTVRGTTVTVTSTRSADVRIAIDSSGKGYAIAVRALEVDGWLPRARLVTSRGARSDTLRGRSGDGAQAAALVILSSTPAPAALALHMADGSGMRVVLGPILTPRLIELLQHAADRAHALFAQGTVDPSAPNRGPGPPCAERMEQLHQSSGYPESYSKYDDGGYHSEAWSYDNGALSFTFIWTDGEQGCKVTTFQSH